MGNRSLIQQEHVLFAKIGCDSCGAWRYRFLLPEDYAPQAPHNHVQTHALPEKVNK